MYINELVKFGLSDKEAKVYLALLELEVATVHEVARASHVNRSSTYVVLESLQKRGLVSVSIGINKKSYVVASPDKLLRLAEKNERDRTDARREIAAILPDLKSLYSGTKQKPRVRIFEGKDGIMTALDESLAMREKIMRVYTSGNNMHEFFREYMPRYMKKRASAGIKMFGIHPDTEANRSLTKYQPSFDESVLIPLEKYKFTAIFAIYDNRVDYISHSDEYAIVIESAEIADAMKSAFDLAFEGAKTLTRAKTKTKNKTIPK